MKADASLFEAAFPRCVIYFSRASGGGRCIPGTRVCREQSERKARSTDDRAAASGRGPARTKPGRRLE